MPVVKAKYVTVTIDGVEIPVIGGCMVTGRPAPPRRTVLELETDYQVRFVPKSRLRLMRLVARFLNLFPKVLVKKKVVVNGVVERYRVEEIRPGDRFMRSFATTYRLPFQRVGTIAYPDYWDVTDPELYWLWNHEYVHVEDQRTAWGLLRSFLLLVAIPLPAVLSGRWYLERWAMMVELRARIRTPEQAADMLWRDYLWAWPRRWAVAWWRAQLRREGYAWA